MMHPLYQQYSRAAKAVEMVAPDIEGLYYMIGGEQMVTNLPLRVMHAIDTAVPGTSTEKEALMIAAMYVLAQALEQAGDIDVAAVYSPEAMVAVADCAAKKGKWPTTETQARVDAAIHVAMTEEMADLVSKLDLTKAQRVAMQAEVTKGQAETWDEIFEKTNAAALKDLGKAANQALVAVMNGKPQPPRPQPPGLFHGS